MSSHSNELRINWDLCLTLPDEKLPPHVRQLRNELQAQGRQLAGDCSYVYHGCNGDCAEGYGRVDVYCDGGGTGGEPDYWYCSKC